MLPAFLVRVPSALSPIFGGDVLIPALVQCGEEVSELLHSAIFVFVLTPFVPLPFFSPFLKSRRGALCLMRPSFSLLCLPGRRYLSTLPMSFGAIFYVGYPLKRANTSLLFSSELVFAKFLPRPSPSVHTLSFTSSSPPPPNRKRARIFAHMIHTRSLSTAYTAVVDRLFPPFS